MSFHLEIVKNHPSRLLIKLVKGDPKDEIKSMMGVYKIFLAQTAWHTTVQFIHSTNDDQILFFCADDKCWKFEKDCKKIMSWRQDENIFNDESWSKLNGTVSLYYAFENFTIHMISF